MHSELLIRNAVLKDLGECASLNASYVTEHVWQMRLGEVEGQFEVTFVRVRLPWPMDVAYPRDSSDLMGDFRRRECFLVATDRQAVRGFISLMTIGWNKTAWINHLVVDKAWRRQGIGSALLNRALEWAAGQRLRMVTAEAQTKNDPAIQFYQRHGFTFCGFNDKYYIGGDIAMFYARNL